MAWTEQCKIVFKTNADAKLMKQKGRRNVTGALRELSKESDIPFKTLKNWFYEMEKDKCPENGTVEDNMENQELGKDKHPEIPENIPLCYRCEKNNVEISKKTEKPAGLNTKYYGLCGSCRKYQKAIEDLDWNHNRESSSIMTICPECQHVHYISIERIKIEIKENYNGDKG